MAITPVHFMAVDPSSYAGGGGGGIAPNKAANCGACPAETQPAIP